MGIISRFTDVMSANINALLGKLEGDNAEKLLTKYVQDTKANLGQIKAETAAVVAEEMALARKLTDTNELIQKYEKYALEAVKQQNDDDARKFLSYSVNLQTEKQELSRQYELAKQNSEKMRQMTSKIIGELEIATAKVNELKQKLNLAKQREKLNQLYDKSISSPAGDYDNVFDAVQKRLDTAEATANLQKEYTGQVPSDIADLERKYAQVIDKPQADSIDDQLAKMKASL